MTLQKKPLQDYFKRLRKEMVKQSGLFQTDYTKSILPLKYYAVGEYGTHKKRPHYHIIAFNTNKAAIEQAWKLNNIPLGDIHIGDTTDASIGYTLKYISKPGQIPQHKNDDRLPEFSLMSKGLGKNYLTPQMKKWHKKDLLNRAYCALPGDKKIKMPRYYKQQIYNDLQRQKIKIHQVDKIYSKFAALPPGERMKAAEMEYNSNIEASRRKTKKRDPRQTL